MRLLDLVSQCPSDFRIEMQAGNALPPDSACRVRPGYAARVRSCESRYVLSDELVTVCAQLAFAEGDRLSKCLNLVHLPRQNYGSNGATWPGIGLLQSSTWPIRAASQWAPREPSPPGYS